MLDLSQISRRANQLVLSGVQGLQFGKDVVTVQCTINEVLKFIDIDRSVQRELDTDKVTRIGQYIQYGLGGHDIYLSPLLFSARGKGIYNNSSRQFSLDTGDRMYVLDGQHRIKAFEHIKNRLESMMERGTDEEFNRMYADLTSFPVTIQIFTNLTRDEERQLFTDVNSKAASVHNTLLIMYGDSSKDLYAQMVKDIIDWDKNDLFEAKAKTTRTKLMTAATLYLVCKVLNDGSFHARSASSVTPENFEEYKRRVFDFIQAFQTYSPRNYLDRDRYVIATANVILAIGKYVHDVLEVHPNYAVEVPMRRLRAFDWTHKNREFRKLGIDYNHTTQKYKFNSVGRVVPKLSQLLTSNFNSKEHR